MQGTTHKTEMISDPVDQVEIEVYLSLIIISNWTIQKR